MGIKNNREHHEHVCRRRDWPRKKSCPFWPTCDDCPIRTAMYILEIDSYDLKNI